MVGVRRMIMLYRSIKAMRWAGRRCGPRRYDGRPAPPLAPDPCPPPRQLASAPNPVLPQLIPLGAITATIAQLVTLLIYNNQAWAPDKADACKSDQVDYSPMCPEVRQRRLSLFVG